MNTTRSRQMVKKMLQRVRLLYLSGQDIARFARTAPFSVYDGAYGQVASRIMYNVHALEKGLARNEALRLGFGAKALGNLNDALLVYESQGYPLTDFAYVEGRSVLRRYVELHTKAEFDLSFLDGLVDSRLLAEDDGFGAAGTKVIRKSEKLTNATKGFYELAQGRSSVREFSGDPIDHSKVLAAVRNAGKTPSVCNRQGWRVYWVEDKDLAAQVLRHQRGFGYRQMPEVLLTITASNHTYLSPVERNQGFVDGGLFAMSVMYGLEHEGLAAVPLNACMYSKDQKAVRKLLTIDDAEVIVMFIAVGDFPDETIVPISDRKPTESFVFHR